MLELKGKYNTCKIYNDKVDQVSFSQVYDILNDPTYKDSTIRFMPDIHAGKGCVIGTTMTVSDKISPNLVGVDISCGVLVYKIKNTNLDLPTIDEFIRKNIPHGQNISSEYDKRSIEIVNQLRCVQQNNRTISHKIKIQNEASSNKNIQLPQINTERAYKSLGSLGGG